MMNIISLGAGVQSSTMALMAAHGEITPMPDCAIFADTHAEPKAVYDWLEKLTPMLPFPVITASKGSLTELLLMEPVRSKKSGKLWIKAPIPAYIDGHGLLGRKCTEDFKVNVLRRTVKKFIGLKPSAHWPKETVVTQWLGISMDEMQRMKTSIEAWQEFRHPLIEKRMTRTDCLQWMVDNGYPQPPRSACIYCPFHSNEEWRRLTEEEFAECVEIEKKLHKIVIPVIAEGGLKGLPYLHNSRVPLDEADLGADDPQQSFSFLDECAGMCGV